MTQRIELHSCLNDDCEMLCSKEKRKQCTDDSLCNTASSKQDNLPVRCVGPWAYNKIYFLSRYFDIFATGMKNKWDGKLAYFEICSGPGRCIDRETGNEMDGTPLAILHSKGFQYLRDAYFLDIKKEVLDSLNSRIKSFNLEHKAHAIYGNYEDGSSITDLINRTNPYGLNLVFIDPTDCSVPFATIEKIAQNKHTDIIMNVAVWTDLNRNLQKAILNSDYESRSKYETFLGDHSFFVDPEIVDLARKSMTSELRTQYMNRYRLHLNQLGLEFIGEKEINGYYNLVFASSNSKALEFWHKAADTIQPDGQRLLL